MSDDIDKEKLVPLADALNLVDREIRLLIQAELAESLVSAQAAEELAAARLSDAQKALDGPQARITELDGQIAQAERERAKWAMGDGDREYRVKARQMIPVIEEDIALIAAEKRRIEGEIMPLVTEHREAQRELGAAHEQVALLDANISVPFMGYGQATDAYSLHQHYGLTTVLMSGDRSHPEWNAGIRFLEKLCLRTGYRTDDLPTDAEQTKRFWDSVYDNANAVPPTTVANVNQAESGVMIVDKSNGVADDFRNVRPATISRPEMNVQKVPQQYRAH